MAITSTVLTTSAANVFVASGQQAITLIYLCNTSTVDTVGVSLNALTGIAPGNNNAMYSNLTITPEDTYVMSTERLILNDTNAISAVANVGNVITVTVSSIAI